jgi:crotonobetainyl-CoA:carnitine CoA-transferase CaiB-like acyl-CoA transferase
VARNAAPRRCARRPVQTIDEAFSLAERLGLDVVDDTDGVRTVRFPARLSETPAVTRRRPPDLDEQGGEIRSEFGR